MILIIEKTGWTYEENKRQPDWLIGNMILNYSAQAEVASKKNGG